ncbi:sporulation and cell division protein SsgA [Motilibacter rhizosphaerae]|uniref:Sporulation and cell division protein SsgA n=1 Tax=Motilibacter rhizosphaerae TaxID=598652 RepID=A0A4V2F4I7_9ACTN|nr:SsgA family sporulation/cell division regulator [Motilibacter rhizosphaerae]RZS89459.1 sporulation and cell division protein SsgA [Motilibacter rhizosphaerae]
MKLSIRKGRKMDRRPTAQVTCDLEVRLVVPGETSLPVPVSLAYDSSDPYAVSARFRTGAHGVDWVFARELLSAGVNRPVGQGDVRVWPGAGPDDDEVVYIALSSPDGRALLEAPARELRDFVARTALVVPPGEESRHLDMDSTLAALLQA